MEDTLRVNWDVSELNDDGEVLILVLMEDTLRDMADNEKACLKAVLILVLMEDTLRGKRFQRKASVCSVLILVLMEDTLREQ